MNRLGILFGMLSACGAPPITPSAPLVPAAPSNGGVDVHPVTALGFGSCNNQTNSQAFWTVIAEQNPEAFLMLGDNVYGDLPEGSPSSPALPELEAAYALQDTHPSYQAVRERILFYTTWDDHDYGLNDAGGDFAFRSRAEDLFLDFWDAPKQDPRRTRAGIYNEWTVESHGFSIQLIALDTRSFRSPLILGPEGGFKYPAGPMVREPCWVRNNGDGSKRSFSAPLILQIVMSSIQVISTHHGWERWDTCPMSESGFCNSLIQWMRWLFRVIDIWEGCIDMNRMGIRFMN